MRGLLQSKLRDSVVCLITMQLTIKSLIHGRTQHGVEPFHIKTHSLNCAVSVFKYVLV